MRTIATTEDLITAIVDAFEADNDTADNDANDHLRDLIARVDNVVDAAHQYATSLRAVHEAKQDFCAALENLADEGD